MSGNSKNVLPIILGVIIIALLGLNAFFLANKVKQTKVIEKQQHELSEAEKIQEELQVQYDDAIEQLDLAAAENEDLRNQVEKQKKKLERDLRRAKSRINELVNKENTSIQELADARRLVDDFVIQRDGYLNEINTLKAQNQVLSNENSTLATAKIQLETQVVETTKKVEEQIKVTETLKVEKEQLSEEKDKLERLGSVLQAHSVKAVGIKQRKKGDLETDVAKKSDKIRVCFEVAENKITKAGPVVVFMRLINPRGETIAIESQGSGYFDDPKSGQAIRYTTSETIDYDNSAVNVCMDWKQTASFDKGKYTAEIYNSNYLIGSKEFTLR